MFNILGDGSWLNTLIYFAMFFAFIFIYPKLMIKQLIMKIENETKRIEGWRDEARDTVTVTMRDPPSKDLKDSVTNFLDFFMIEPVNLDPRGVVKKLDRTIRDQRTMFKRFVEENSDIEDEEKRADIRGGLSGAIATQQIAKIVRHYLELTKKYNNLQIAMMIKMQLPMIKDIARAAVKGTKNMCNGEPVGDTIGPLVVAKMIGNDEFEEMEDHEMIYSEKEINDRKCVLVKAKGPGSRVGLPGKALEDLIDKYKPERIITIDASGKLEGEETGSTAEGVGVAMGGYGVERYQIEEKATKKEIPIDAIAIKMRPEEAIYSMKEEVFDSVDGVIDKVKNALYRAEKGNNVLILGVGNTSGVGNNGENLKETEKKIKKNIKKMKKEREREKQEEKSLMDQLSPF
ncbi:MAG: DUF1512 family protein [Candidatus Aenigmatarchaeota archaeon]